MKNGDQADIIEESVSVPNPCSLPVPQEQQAVRLPSLREFDQAVAALAEQHGPVHPWTPPPSPPHEDRRNPFALEPFTHDTLHNRHLTATGRSSGQVVKSKSRHINQQYTKAEGDWILDAVEVKKMRWKDIREGFTDKFGDDPPRSVQGLQAYYYRKKDKKSDRPLDDQESSF
ncbi:hypothetical protein FSARC_2953 [Fusarium sarcochroum]|uniref:Uncharacterized protein n=1 Tax=Fusarium sarcochroum TaxID=1208366 RepID=A0A8H4U517_9HYPO|nr:hypothetical protein FSARC_2953 [Fusarium sarcochroum]